MVASRLLDTGLKSGGLGLQDLANIRIAAAFLSKTELRFDLVSAVDELAAQIKLEFDFEREARVMDSIAEHLKVILHL